MERDTQQDAAPAQHATARPPPPYEPPAIAWEEPFEAVAASGDLNPFNWENQRGGG